MSVYQGEVKQKSCGTLQLTYGLEQSDQIYTLICNIEGDNVKLSKSKGYLLVIDIAVTSKCTLTVLLCKYSGIIALAGLNILTDHAIDDPKLKT